LDSTKVKPQRKRQAAYSSDSSLPSTSGLQQMQIVPAGPALGLGLGTRFPSPPRSMGVVMTPLSNRQSGRKRRVLEYNLMDRIGKFNFNYA